MSSVSDALSEAWSYFTEYRSQISVLFIVIVSILGLIDGKSVANLAIIVLGIAWLMNYRPIP